jgi:hypothetical protein
MKYYTLVLACMLFVLDTPASAAQQSKNTGEKEQPHSAAPAEIILTTETGKRPTVFPHAKHQTNINCDTCHKNANFPADKKWDFKQGHAFCMDCHKAKNEGPTKCNGCHE